MKRNIAFLAAIVFVLSFVVCSFSTADFSAQATQAQSARISVGELKCDTSGIVIGETKAVTFMATVKSTTKLKSTDVCVVDSNDEFIAYMRDDGHGGDLVANDDTYTAIANLSRNESQQLECHAKVGLVSGASQQIAFHKSVTDKDWAISDDIWAHIDRLEAQLESNNATDKEIVQAVYSFLSDSQYVEDIRYDSDLEISFEFTSGIPNIFARASEDQKAAVGKIDYAAEIVDELTKENNYIGSTTIGVWAPYYGYDSNFSYNYSARASAMQQSLETATVNTYYGAEASVESFKKWDEYGIIMVDSHGASNNGGGYICIPAPGDYDRQDVVEGRLVLSGSSVYLTGTFFQKYCDMLPNSIIYIGICYGLAADNLYAPLLNHGAGFICGYTNSVSFVYDGQIMDEYHIKLVSTNPSTNELYTTGEAWRAACDRYGSADPYISDHAEFVYHGNTSIRAKATLVPVEDVTLTPTELSMYNQNSYQLEYAVAPIEANRFSVSWKSDSDSAVTVSDKGVVTTLSEGKATITCTVTDTSVTPVKEFSAVCVVTSLGNLVVSGIEVDTPTLELYAGNMKTQIVARVLPENATNKTILYQSSDETIVTVDEYGIVTPIKNGTAIVKLTTQDGGFVAYVICTVSGSDINTALNMSGGDLKFTNALDYPWQQIVRDDRVVMQSGNSGANLTRSVLTLNAGVLPVGTIIKFDWSVSSETRWDTLGFTVNDSATSDILPIAGETRWSTNSYTIPTDGEYVFSWYYNKDTSISGGADCGWIDNVEIIVPNAEYTVDFMDGETLLAKQTVLHGQTATAPSPTPTHEGFIFLGWDKQFAQVRSNMTINAVYMVDPNYIPPAKYTVTFTDYNGTVISTQIVEEGEAALAPTTPEREGYLFIGWDVDFASITGDLTVTALYALIGDANSDGLLNTGDAVKILRYSVGVCELSDVEARVSDLNDDKIVNTGDATALLILVTAQ